MVYINNLVSVIIPTYRRSEMIVRAIQSVLDQTYPYIECIVVNDNERNDEHSLQLMTKIGSFIENNKIVFLEQDHHKNGAAARNFGITHAKGEYIAFLDDDDWWSADKIAKEIEFIRIQDKQCGAVSTLATYYKNGKIIRKTLPYKDGKIYKEIMARELDIITCSLLMKHCALDETGYFDETLKRHQEIQLLGFFTERFSIKLLPEYLTFICVDDNQNRPDSEKSKKYKEDFFIAVGPVLNNIRKSDKRYIMYMHKIEIINLYLKEKHFLKAIKELIKLLSCPRALFGTIKRVTIRLKEQKV